MEFLANLAFGVAVGMLFLSIGIAKDQRKNRRRYG